MDINLRVAFWAVVVVVALGVAAVVEVGGVFVTALLNIVLRSYRFLSIIPSSASALSSTFGARAGTNGFVCNYCDMVPTFLSFHGGRT